MLQYWLTNSNIDGVGRSVYQIVLQEGSTDILFNYDAQYGASSAGSDKNMTGIENDDGSIGLRYPGFDKWGTYTSRSVRFYLGSAPNPVYDLDKDGYNSDVDCNDNNSKVNPGAQEICGDGIDNNCNGQVDEDCSSGIDRDKDGYDNDVDCDDYNSSIHPGAKEICGDKIDNNCNGLIDEYCTTPVDRDDDGYKSDVDCDDYDAAVHPGAAEVCDGKDNDCDGSIDEGCNTVVDNDGDGYDEDNDCDDSRASIHPGAAEICDGIDNDCDGVIDEGCGESDPGVGGPDAFGYRYITSDDFGGPAYRWETFGEEAQSLRFNADDGLVNAIPMGFFYDATSSIRPYFEFYGEKYNNVYIAGNGYLTFTPDSKYTNFAYEGQGFPAVDEANNLIAPFWLGGQSAAEASALITVVYETLGVEPQRRFVMQLTHYSENGQQIAYQVVFFEGENTIQFNYKEVASLGADYLVAGIENSDGTVGLRYVALEETGEATERSVLFYRGDPPVDPDPDPEQGSGLANIYMPLVMTGNWQTSVILLNDSGTETVVGTLKGHNSFGEVVVFSEEVVLAPLARTEALLSDFFGEFDVEIAYLTFVANIDTIVGSVRLKVQGQGMVGAYPALSHASAAETLYLPTVMVGDNDWNSIASLVNASSDDCVVNVEFDNGASTRISLKAGQQFYLHPALEVLYAGKRVLLNDTHPTPTNAFISGGKGLVGAALYYQGEKLSATALDANVTEQVVYPYLPDDSAWWGGLALYNPQFEVIDTTFAGYNSDGSEAELVFTEGSLGYLQTQQIQSGNLLLDGKGWLQVDASKSIAGMEFVGTFDGKQLASVATGRLKGRSGVFSRIRSGEEGVWSGLVLVNSGAEETQVTLAAYDDSGNNLAEARKTIPAQGQLITAVYTLFGGADIASATFIRFVAESDIVGVLFNGRNYKINGYAVGELEALPPLRLATTGDRY